MLRTLSWVGGFFGWLIAVGAAAEEISDLSKWRIVEEQRFSAPEARQGVAVDEDFIYVIGNKLLRFFSR